MLRTLSRSEIAESRTRRVSVLMLIVLSVLLLAACENGWIRAKGERGALTYYQNKYGVEVDVVSVKTWGDTTSILPTKINQMVFRMSDGSTVLWDREAEQYADTHQAEEIGDGGCLQRGGGACGTKRCCGGCLQTGYQGLHGL